MKGEFANLPYSRPGAIHGVNSKGTEYSAVQLHRGVVF